MSGHLMHVVGARPNFMKAGPVITALDARGAEQRLVHTGQHYDDAMSDVFFRELGLRKPDVNLGVGSGSHATQTADLLTALEGVMLESRPSRVVVYGDVNSTLAAALVAAKLHVPVAHVEAGLRSFDWAMPEEVNRRVADTLSDLLFVTAPEGMVNLAREGAHPDGIHFVGNPMIDTLLSHLDALDPVGIRAELDLEGDYAVATLHRPNNVDDEAAAERLVGALHEVAGRLPILLPLHPRGRPVLERVGLLADDRVCVVDPMGYLDFMSAVRGARLVITDSGGVQEETTVLRIPCLTVRPNTERPVTITHGSNRVVAAHELAEAVDAALAGRHRVPDDAPPLWDGHAGERIADVLVGGGQATPSRS